ncbi:IclR family transcriptional regulator domain-containing protein [Amorphus orientalis]|uniref:IclR family pca regulon transcriptional regulator n=1 Tax=Amorphus orientalis TaxID=649198 RepID=A0AAE3VLH2_9HYPH|nr:IclR family transcriptional regulator C-terminal domain-containing protein [Amorphus orientalis]MDQ0314709.1 IclR family pca regulon transcriptional regulator [Amorphus orientalis]
MPRVNRTEEQLEARRKDPDFVESLDRGLRVIEAFGRGPGPTTLSDIAKAADLSRATARRILITLQRCGYVRGDGKYFELCPSVLRLASGYLSSNQIVSVLQPVMDEVAAEAREVCSLAIADGDEAVFIARASPARVFSGGIDVGYRLPLFCTSVGRVLLGGYDDDALRDRLDAMEIEKQTEFTVTDRRSLFETIVADRERGYSLADQEAEDGFRSLSVPVRRYDDRIVAAMNIGGHVDRLSTTDLLDRFLPILKKAAGSVSRQLV